MGDDQSNFKVCSKCNTQNDPWAKYCNHCGRRLNKSPRAEMSNEGIWLGSDLRLQQGTKAIQRMTSEAKQAVEQAINGTRKLLDARTGSAYEVKDTDLQRQIQRAPLELAPYITPDVSVKYQTCLRCGMDRRPAARFCPACGERYYESWGKPLHFQAAVISDKGKVRSNNEDNARLKVERRGMVLLGVIADGMGGHNAGEVASREAVEAIMKYINEKVMSPDRQIYAGVELPLELNHAVEHANKVVFNQASQNAALRQMGTTVTIALLQDDRAYLAHVGDSRAYLINRHGAIWQITNDHTLVASLVAIGQISEAEAATHPQRSVLYRSVGIEPNLTVDTFTRRLYSGDSLVLCSDGLTRYVQPGEIAAQVRSDAAAHNSPAEACAQLVELANSRGGEDNISVIVIHATAEG
jgi:serine/threonine protein phosphatase PrpC/ribosomal protein L40E